MTAFNPFTPDPLRATAQPGLAPQAQENTYRWATVVGTAPLEIKFDGDHEPLATSPDNVAGFLVVGQRVWCQLFGRRVIIIGGAQNTPQSQETVAGRRSGGTATSVPSGTVTNVDPGPANMLYGGVTASGLGLQIPVTGIWTAQAAWRWTYNTSGLRQIRIDLSGYGTISVADGTGGNETYQKAIYLGPLQAGQIVTMSVYQDSGGTLSSADFGDAPQLTIAMIGRTP